MKYWVTGINQPAVKIFYPHKKSNRHSKLGMLWSDFHQHNEVQLAPVQTFKKLLNAAFLYWPFWQNLYQYLQIHLEKMNVLYTHCWFMVFPLWLSFNCLTHMLVSVSLWWMDSCQHNCHACTPHVFCSVWMCSVLLIPSLLCFDSQIFCPCVCLSVFSL